MYSDLESAPGGGGSCKTKSARKSLILKALTKVRSPCIFTTTIPLSAPVPPCSMFSNSGVCPDGLTRLTRKGAVLGEKALLARYMSAERPMPEREGKGKKRATQRKTESKG